MAEGPERLGMARNLVKESDLLDIAQYERARPEIRAKVMALKDRRRVRAGPNFMFLFENHTTILYQIQEMMRVERIVDPVAIRHEIETYNELVPPEGGLSATLFLEYESRELREDVLPKLVGIENYIWLELRGFDRIKAEFDTRQIGEGRVSSVQYLRFALSEAQRGQWQDLGGSAGLKIVVDHPHYSHEETLTPDTAAALAEDLS